MNSTFQKKKLKQFHYLYLIQPFHLLLDHQQLDAILYRQPLVFYLYFFLGIYYKKMYFNLIMFSKFTRCFIKTSST